MILFNWAKIKEYTGGNCEKCLRIVEVLTGVRNATRKDIIILSKLKKAGNMHNWLDMPKELLYANASSNDKCVYIELSTYRNRYKVKETGKNKIPLHFLGLTHFAIDRLKWNNLLIIENDGIYFKY